MMKILPMIPKWGIRGKLLASFLVSLGPLILLGYLLAWERDVLPYLILAGLLSLLLALVAIWWLTRPLSQLTCRALNMVEEFIPEVSAKGGDEIEQLAGVLESISTQLTRALAERRMLYSIGQNSTVYFDLDNILSEIAESAVELLGATSGVIGLWDKEKQVFRDATLVNLPQELLEREFPIEESLTTHVVERGHPIVLDDYSTYPRRLTLLDSYQFKGAIGVPLLVHGECIGSLVVLTTDPARRFSAQDVELLARFANQAAVAIQNIKL
ncbi:MAG TPA: GAF domain-containing protein, partial [Anaerolineae bacterium]|nr:GAF domain-containing protein [Anaerolineae bacterium]